MQTPTSFPRNDTASETMYDPFVEHPIPTSVGLFILAAAIVLLNLIAILVFIQRRGNKPPVDYPLLSLLIANLLQGTMTLPAYALKKINAFGEFEQAIICDIYRFSFFVCAHASIMSLLVSTLDRLIALFYSLRYWEIVTRSRITVVVLLSWLFVICFDMVPLITTVEGAKCHYTPVKEWSISMHTVMNIVPLPLLLAGYTVTIRIAYRHARKNPSVNTKNMSKREKMRIICGIRATRKVTMIIGSYFVCVGPACVYYLLEWLCTSCFTADYKHYREQYVHFFLKVLVNVYAVVSAVIFYWNSKDFRRKAREVISGRERSKASLENCNGLSSDQRHFLKKKDVKSNGNLETDCRSCSLEPRDAKIAPLEEDFMAVDDDLRIDNTKEEKYRKSESLFKHIFVRGIFANSANKDDVDSIPLPNVI